MAESSAQPDGQKPAAASGGEARRPLAVPDQDQVRREACPSRTSNSRPDDVRRQGPGHQLSADHPLRPPKGAPNVLIVLLDDVVRRIVGLRRAVQYAQRRAAGGRRVEAHPLSHHGAVLADPAALLTGRNHHSVGMGGITEIATSAPGNSSCGPRTRRRSPRSSS